MQALTQRGDGLRLFFGDCSTFRRDLGLGRSFGFRRFGVAFGFILRGLRSALGFTASGFRLLGGIGLLALHQFFGLLLRFFDRQHFEALDGVGNRTDFVLAIEAGQRDIEFTGGKPLHGHLNGMQRAGHATRNREHDPDGGEQCEQQQSSLDAQTLHRGCALISGIVFRHFQRAFSNLEKRSEFRHRQGRPVVGLDIHFLAGDQALKHYMRRSLNSCPKNSFLALAMAALNLGGSGKPDASSSRAPQAVSSLARLFE